MDKSIIVVVVLVAALAGVAVWFLMPKGEIVSHNDVATSAPAQTNNDTQTQVAATPQAIPLTISMTSFSFTLEGQAANDTITLNAGQTYAITLVNDGAIGHEAKIGKGDMIQRDDGTPDGYTDNFFADVSAVLTKSGAMGENSGENDSEASASELEEVELDAGESATITFTVPDNLAGQTFEIGCFVPGHYEAGMMAAITVE